MSTYLMNSWRRFVCEAIRRLMGSGIVFERVDGTGCDIVDETDEVLVMIDILYCFRGAAYCCTAWSRNLL